MTLALASVPAEGILLVLILALSACFGLLLLAGVVVVAVAALRAGRPVRLRYALIPPVAWLAGVAATPTLIGMPMGDLPLRLLGPVGELVPGVAAAALGMVYAARRAARDGGSRSP